MGEKIEFSGWWFWVLGLMLVSAVAIFALNSAGLIFAKKVERSVLVNSHQYIEGMAQRGATISANLAEAEALYSAEINPDVKAGIKTQISILKAQLSAIKRVEDR